MKHVFTLLALTLAIVACAPAPTPKITVTRDGLVVVQRNQTKKFVALLENTAGSPVWSLEPNVGSLSPNNLEAIYTAPNIISAAQNITVKACVGSICGTEIVTLEPPPAFTVLLDKNSIVGLPVGGACGVTATVQSSTEGVTWRSSNEAVATVSSAGLVTAVSAGQAQISAVALGNPSSQAVLTVDTVAENMAKLTATISNPRVSVNDLEPIAAKLENMACANLSFVASAGSISSEGLFTAPSAAGTSTVTVEATTGSVKRTVVLPLEIAFWSPSNSLPTGLQIQALHSSPTGEIYAGTNDGVLRFDANSETWIALRGTRGGLENTSISSLEFMADGTLLVGTDNGVYKQAFGSSSFVRTASFNATTPYTTGLPVNQTVFDLLKVGNTMYAALEAWTNNGSAYQVFKLENDVWSALPPLPETRNAVSLTTLGSDIVVSLSNGAMYQFTSGTWNLLSSTKPNIGSLQTIGSTIYGTRAISGDNGVFKLEAGTWSLEKGGFPFGQLLKNGSGLLWADSNLVRNNGQNWAGLGSNATLPFNARHIAVARDGRVYVSFLDAAQVWQVWRSPKAAVSTDAPAVNVTGITVNPSSVAMRVGTFQPLGATVVGGTGVIWLSSNEAIARVSEDGVLEGIGNGTTTVLAIARDNPSFRSTITVTVSSPDAVLSGITLHGANELEVASSTQLQAQLETNYLTTQATTEPDARLIWTSSDTNLATVSLSGLVTGIAVGSVTIRASSVAKPNLRGEIVLQIKPSTVLAGNGEWQLEALLPLNITPNNLASLEFRILAVHGTRLYASVQGNGTWSKALTGNTWTRETLPSGSNLPDVKDFASGSNVLIAAAANGKVLILESGSWRESSVGGTEPVTQVLIVGSTWYAGISSDGTNPAKVMRFDGTSWVSTGTGLGIGNNNSIGALGGLAVSQNQIYTVMSNGFVYKLEAGIWQTVANQIVDNQGNGVRLRDIVADDTGNLFVTGNGLQILAAGSSTWRTIHSISTADRLSYTGTSILIGASGDALELRLPSLMLVRLGSTDPFLNKNIKSVVLDASSNTVYAGLSFPDVGMNNIYKVQPDPRAAGINNDLPLTSASYLGSSGGDNAMGADIQPDGSLVLAGRLERTNLGQTPTHLLGGGAGAIIRLSFDGKKVLSITRIGDQILDLEVNRSNGQIAIATNLGIAVLSADAKNIIWSIADPSTDSGRRIAIGSDGTVVALTTKKIQVFNATGTEIGSRQLNNSFVLDIAIDANSQSVFVTGMDNKTLPSDNTLPNAPVQVAYLFSYPYDLTNRKWTNWNYSGLDLNGQEADTRGYRVSMGRDNKLYFLGENAGGNSIFRWDPRSPIGIVSNGRRGLIETSCNCWINFDQYNQPYNSASPHFAYYARLEPSTGTILKGQFLVPRLPNTQSNTFRVRAISADENGQIIIGGLSAYGIENRSGKRVAGQNLGEYGGADLTIVVISSDLRSRVAWHPFNKDSGTDTNNNGITEAFNGGSSEATAVAASNGKVVYAAIAAAGQFVTTNAIQANPSSDLSKFDTDAFFAVVPLK